MKKNVKETNKEKKNSLSLDSRINKFLYGGVGIDLRTLFGDWKCVPTEVDNGKKVVFLHPIDEKNIILGDYFRYNLALKKTIYDLGVESLAKFKMSFLKNIIFGFRTIDDWATLIIIYDRKRGLLFKEVIFLNHIEPKEIVNNQTAYLMKTIIVPQLDKWNKEVKSEVREFYKDIVIPAYDSKNNPTYTISRDVLEKLLGHNLEVISVFQNETNKEKMDAIKDSFVYKEIEKLGNKRMRALMLLNTKKFDVKEHLISSEHIPYLLGKVSYSIFETIFNVMKTLRQGTYNPIESIFKRDRITADDAMRSVNG